MQTIRNMRPELRGDLCLAFGSMSKTSRVLPMLVSLCLAVACLTACGGGGVSGDVVAQVGSTAITKTEVNHWMTTLIGGDYYEVSHKHTVPAGLVSEPANYASCEAKLEAGAAHAATRLAKLTAAQLLTKCRQLYQALKQQAVAYLVEAQWLIDLAGEEGVTASNQEVNQLFGRVKAEYPSEAKLQQFLASNRRSVADEMLVVKLDVLREKLSQKAAAGGKQALLKLIEDGRKWTAKTNCSSGYVVPHCKQYEGEAAAARESGSAHPSAAVLLEQVATIIGATTCVARAACG